MKIVALIIEKLYGCFDYSVQFNKDVTFIYGANGCGKTTILNITEAIITGQLYKLFDYKFDSIVLDYCDNLQEKGRITITYENENLNIKYKDKIRTLKMLELVEDARSFDRNSRDFLRLYFQKYPFLNEIRSTFNYVYLPLNRSAISYDDDFYISSRRFRAKSLNDRESLFDFSGKDISMFQVENLISTSYSKISSSISGINDNFRNEILKSLLEINKAYDLRESIDEILSEENTISTLEDTKDAYIKVLNELDILTEVEKENYNNFFENTIKEFSEYQKKGNKSKFPVDLVMKFQEISKIKKMLRIAEEMEREKSEARKPIETLVNTINDFIGNSADGKEIAIDEIGNIYFKTKYNANHISVHHFSSGEKQLLTFFANLLLNVRDDSSGIFVVDEPELSLHLSWQKIFVEKTLEINNNIQLVFATHSPEIVGPRRDKMFKLEKIFTGEKE